MIKLPILFSIKFPLMMKYDRKLFLKIADKYKDNKNVIFIKEQLNSVFLSIK